MLKKCALFFLILSIVVFSSNAYAAPRQQEMTTYYPAPYGEYVSLKVGTPQSTSGMSALGSLSVLGAAAQINFIDSNHNDWAIHVNSNKMYFIRQPWNYTDLVLDGAGNVGIGTDVPATKLEVKGGPIKATGGLVLPVLNVSGGVDTAPSGPGTDGHIWIET